MCLVERKTTYGSRWMWTNRASGKRPSSSRMRAVCGGDFRTSGRPYFRVSFLRNVVRALPPAGDLPGSGTPGTSGSGRSRAGRPGEAPGHVGRQAGHRAEGELVLAGHPGTQGHLVLVAPPDDEAVGERGGPPLGGQEGVRVEHLEEGRGGELRVEGQQVVQVRRPAAVVPEDEQRGPGRGWPRSAARTASARSGRRPMFEALTAVWTSARGQCGSRWRSGAGGAGPTTRRGSSPGAGGRRAGRGSP